MDSDHAPVLCHVKLDGPFNNKNRNSKARYNFNKANWNLYREIFEEKIREFPIHESLNNPEALCGYFISSIQYAAVQAIHKFINLSAKSYPEYIINLIKERRLVRKKMDREYNLDKKLCLELNIIGNLRNLKKLYIYILSAGGNFFLTSLALIQPLLGNFGKQ